MLEQFLKCESFVKYWQKNFDKLYFHKKRHFFIPYINEVVKDLRQTNTHEGLIRMYMNNEFFAYLSHLLSDIYIKDISMIEDASYAIRFCEIELGMVFGEVNKVHLCRIYPKMCKLLSFSNEGDM